MPKVLPPGIDLFLTAESVRQEPGGKLTIIGAIMGGPLLVPAGTSFPIGIPLALLVVFQDGEGEFDTSIRIVDVAGAAMGPDVPLGIVTKIAGQPMHLSVNFGAFIVQKPGTYKVEIRLDSHVYTKDFTVGFIPN
jgi:hypothetical protein